MYAHGGIVAAAAAILQDMEQHQLLRRLLEDYDPDDQQHIHPRHRYPIFHLTVILRSRLSCALQKSYLYA